MKKFPNALVIMIGFILFASLLTLVIPQGSYDRVFNEDVQREAVVPGSYHQVNEDGLSLYDVALSVPEGIIGRGELIVLIFLLGGCFVVIEKTGALQEGVIWLSNKLRGSEATILVIVGALFATGGVLQGLQEEVIAMTPVLIYLCKRLGYNTLVAIAVSFGSAIIGGAFSPINPFGVIVAQNVAELPLLSGAGFRLVVLFIAFGAWMIMTIRYARKHTIEKEESNDETSTLSTRSVIILSLLGLTFAILVYGMMNRGWGFNEISAEFFILGIISGLVGKLGINGTSEAYIDGFREMTFAAIIIGLANSISIVLEKGVIIDTVIYGLFLPLQHLPTSISAISMMVSQAFLHIPVPSYSGQAVLTMPILIPLSDLIGLSRQVCVLAYQYGAITMDIIIPTNGALMAILAIAKIDYKEWFQFIWKFVAVIFVISAVSLIVAVYLGI